MADDESIVGGREGPADILEARREREEQEARLRDLCARLNDTLRRPLAIYGHSMWIPDVAGATKGISKQCPGPLFAAAYKEVRLEVRTAGQVHLGV